MIDIIIDIETLGTRPGCPVIEIGACAINGATGEITANFSRRVRSDWGLVESPADEQTRDTVLWWRACQQREAVLCAIMRNGDRADDANAVCVDFWAWFSKWSQGDYRVWGNGPTFDLSILARLFDDERVALPWKPWNERCVRTALELANYEKGSVGWIERGPRHRALNDARHEARKLFYSGALGEVSSILKRLRQRYDVKARQA